MWILGKYSNRTQWVLHRFQTTLRTRSIVGNAESVLSTWCVLLKDDLLFPDTRLNENRHQTEQCLGPFEVRVLARDQNLIIFQDFIVVHINSPQINTLVFGSNISSSSVRFNCRRRFVKTFSTYTQRLASYGGPTWSSVADFQSFVAVPRNPLNFLACCLGHSLWVLDSVLDNVPPAISQGSFHGPRIQVRMPRAIGKHLDQKKRIAICSSLLKSNTLTSALLPQVLLPSSCLEFSSTWSLPFSTERKWLRENIERFILLTKQKKITPLFTRETAFSQQVSELVFGVSIFDLDLGIQVDSVKQPIKSNSVSSGHMSHHRTSSFDDHSFVVFKNVHLGSALRIMCVNWSHVVVCFLHIQLKGTTVRLPTIQKILPEVDFESSRSPEKSESWDKTSP